MLIRSEDIVILQQGNDRDSDIDVEVGELVTYIFVYISCCGEVKLVRWVFIWDGGQD